MVIKKKKTELKWQNRCAVCTNFPVTILFFPETFLYETGNYWCMDSGSLPINRSFLQIKIIFCQGLDKKKRKECQEGFVHKGELKITYLRRTRAWGPWPVSACAGTRAASSTGRCRPPRTACRSRPAPPQPSNPSSPLARWPPPVLRRQLGLRPSPPFYTSFRAAAVVRHALTTHGLAAKAMMHAARDQFHQSLDRELKVIGWSVE